MSDKVINVFSTISLFLLWCGILFISYILFILSDVIRTFGNGILVYVFAFIYVMAFLVPIIFRKKLKKYCSLPLNLIIFTILAVIINAVIYCGVKSYICEYSKEKWDRNEKLRIYMIADLENEHQIVGKTEKEIIGLLGEPTYIRDEENRYAYYVGDSIIDPYTYDIIFEDGIAKETEVIEH